MRLSKNIDRTSPVVSFCRSATFSRHGSRYAFCNIFLSHPPYGRKVDCVSRYIAPKGSITLDGTSFTVNEADGSRFTINVIDHTLAVTTWKKAALDQKVNIEIDMLARYVARLRDYEKG